ncbi:MAG TPA: class I SAM-dependent methyltransferase [Acidimicrobiia bacterium]|nr:class I SAM-dependent methyltransferase [Acidimicrobiia bacterium]
MTYPANETAKRIFSPIGSSYERWAAILSLGQDARWRRTMVEGLQLQNRATVLDVAAGTGSISRLLQDRGHQVTAVDLTREMIRHHPGPWRILARGERLPFADRTFDGLTFGYLLRYVDDPVASMAELARVVRPGGVIGMVEFGLPAGLWRAPWTFYSSVLLPVAGRLIGRGWYQVGKFLKPSIEQFHKEHHPLETIWRSAGLVEVRTRRMSLGGGILMWGRRP